MDRVQGRVEQQPDAPRVEHERLALCASPARDLASLVPSLLDDLARLRAALLLHVLAACSAETSVARKQVLELLVPRELGLEPLDAVAEVDAVAPHLLVAVRDVIEHLVDGSAVVAEQPALERYVPELDR